MFTSDVIKARNVTSSISNVVYQKILHGAAFYTLNGKTLTLCRIFDQSFKIIFQGVKKMKSGREKLTDRRTSEGQTDGGHDIIRPVFDGRIKYNNYSTLMQFHDAGSPLVKCCLTLLQL